jgi:hypothetical protein
MQPFVEIRRHDQRDSSSFQQSQRFFNVVVASPAFRAAKVIEQSIEAGLYSGVIVNEVGNEVKPELSFTALVGRQILVMVSVAQSFSQNGPYTSLIDRATIQLPNDMTVDRCD